MRAVNRGTIADYLPTKPQVVRAVGYLGEGACEIAALAATYIATIQVARRFECATGFGVNEIPFHAEIVNFDTHPCIPALFTTAAIGLHNLGSKINRCMGNYAETLAKGLTPIEEKKQAVIIKEMTSSDDEMINPSKDVVSKVLTPASETQGSDNEVEQEEQPPVETLFSDDSVSETGDFAARTNDLALEESSPLNETE